MRAAAAAAAVAAAVAKPGDAEGIGAALTSYVFFGPGQQLILLPPHWLLSFEFSFEHPPKKGPYRKTLTSSCQTSNE